MLKAVLLFIFVAACHGSEEYGRPIIGGRVVGGSTVSITQAPFQVSISALSVHKCGGAIISNQWVITAAHCTNIYSANQLMVRAGSQYYNSLGVQYYVSQIVNHPSFSPSKMTNDISLLKTGTFTFSSTIQPISIVRADLEFTAGTYATFTGWGSTAQGGSLSTLLMKLDLPVVSDSLCNAIYSGITDTMLCAGYTTGGKDICQGDYGGPLVINGELVGVASWGDGCAQANHPSVYTKLSKYRDWIEINAGV